MSIVDFEQRFVKPRPGRTLIVGSRVYNEKPDRRLLYEPQALGVDMLPGEGVDQVQDMEHPAAAGALGQFDHVECLSVLEHARRPWFVAEVIEACMLPGATLFVSVPFCWPIHAYPDDYWRISPAALEVLFPRIEWIERRLGSQRLISGTKIERRKLAGFPYFPRTETFGFGVRR